MQSNSIHEFQEDDPYGATQRGSQQYVLQAEDNNEDTLYINDNANSMIPVVNASQAFNIHQA